MRVYHFINEVFGLKDIRERRLKISRIMELNDPFEYFGVELTVKHTMKEIDYIKEYQSRFSGKIDKSKKMNIHPLPECSSPFVIERGGEELGCTYLYYEREFIEPVVWIMYLKTYKQGQGYGSEILRSLCDLADLLKVSLYLEPAPDRDSNLNHTALVAWYKGYGFVGQHTMERKPNA